MAFSVSPISAVLRHFGEGANIAVRSSQFGFARCKCWKPGENKERSKAKKAASAVTLFCAPERHRLQ